MCNVILLMEQYIALDYGIKIKKGQKAPGEGTRHDACSAPELWTATLAGPENCTLQMWNRRKLSVTVLRVMACSGATIRIQRWPNLRT